MADNKKRRKRVKNPSRKPTSPRSAVSSPTTKKKRPLIPKAISSKLVPILMFGFFGIGVALIIINYLPGVIPGGSSNTYLLVGLLFILFGFVAATRYE